ncbi:DUF2391 family protein [Candidatus Woesearchaeota archaeon]|nr:DUF2391 family protein [Candidatus Woesearchaeota archaeon]
MKKRKRGSISKKLDLVLKGQERLLKEDLKIEKQGLDEEKKEEEVKQLEEKQLTELEKLERIEKEVENEVKQHPLTKVTTKDVFRGSLGAFVGTTLHYTVYYGVEIANNLSMTRASIIYVVSFILGIVFLYVTGFRKIRESNAIVFLPLRMIVLYSVSIVVSILVLYLLFPSFGHSFQEAYKQTATVSLIATIGACTADTLGKD